MNLPRKPGVLTFLHCSQQPLGREVAGADPGVQLPQPHLHQGPLRERTCGVTSDSGHSVVSLLSALGRELGYDADFGLGKGEGIAFPTKSGLHQPKHARA